MIRAFVKYWFRPTVKNWRDLRRVCMARLPKAEKQSDVEENGK